MKVKSRPGDPAKRSTPQMRVIQAHRLAAADFYYNHINPDSRAVIMRLKPSQANTLRKSKAYQDQIANLELEMQSMLKKDMQKESDRIKQRMSDLVPAAIERLNCQLDDEGLVGLQAAREVLDRDGRMPKVSRVQQTIEDKRTIPDVSDTLLEEFGVARPN